LESQVRSSSFKVKDHPLANTGQIKTFLRTKQGGIIAVDNL